jgi:hypothetical protein
MKWLLLVALVAGCRTPPTFTCATDDECSGGVCRAGGCAFADTSCSSGYRYDRSARGRGNQCVNVDAPEDMAAPAGTDDMAMADPVDMVRVAMCTAMQTSPSMLDVSAQGSSCRSPAVDGVHVELEATNYQIIVLSTSGFAVGDHDVDVTLNGFSSKGKMHAFAPAIGWMLQVNATATTGPLSVTLSGVDP